MTESDRVGQQKNANYNYLTKQVLENLQKIFF